MQVQRINVSVVESNEVEIEVDLKQIFKEGETALAPALLLEDEPKNEVGDSAEAEICSEPNC